MPVSLLISSLLLFGQTAAPASPGLQLQSPMTIAETVRLALSPTLDGVISDEEWDPLVSSPNLKGYFEWEPGLLHFAAVVPNGNDVIISLDLGANGWLVGSDNVEIRLSAKDGSAKLSARRMDATQVNGPRWVDLPGVVMASMVASKSDATNTTFEATLGDAGLGLFPTESDKRIALRMDSLTSTSASLDPYLPRVLSPVQLSFMRSVALPSGLKWNTEGAGYSVVPGDNIKLRVTFNGDDKMKLERLALRSEGPAHDQAAEMAVPFPSFDSKGRAFVDYRTDIGRTASLGYRLLRASLTDSDGITALMETSYRIAPLLDIDLVKIPIRSQPQPQTVQFAYYVRSQSNHSMKGDVVVVPPDNFRIPTGGDRGFTINGPHGLARQKFRLEIPAAFRGVIPLTFKTQSNGQKLESIQYLNVE